MLPPNFELFSKDRSSNIQIGGSSSGATVARVALRRSPLWSAYQPADAKVARR